MKKWTELADRQSLQKTANALKEKGYEVLMVEKASDALEKIKKLIPKAASVMNGASVTLEEIGYMNYLQSNKHGWDNLHAKVSLENDPQKRAALRKQAVLSDFYLGSVHALTEKGEFVVASNTGSQLPQLAFTSNNLILVIGAQKITTALDEAMKRLKQYVVPREDKHMRDLYGSGTMLSKILIFNAENFKVSIRKIIIILVKEKLGF